MAREIWKPVVGYEGFYEVSNLGRVRGLPRWVNSKNGSFALKAGKVLSHHFHSAGYPQIRLSREGRAKTVCVHRLVCEAFNGPPPSAEHEAAHIDGSRDNNAPDNLCWKTAAGNAADRKVHGTERMGEQIPVGKLTAEQVIEIRAKYQPRYGSLAELGREYGVTRNAIFSIIQRKHWKHI